MKIVIQSKSTTENCSAHFFRKHFIFFSSTQTQKLVRKGGPSNIKFFSMSSRRIAWILAGVISDHEVETFGYDKKIPTLDSAINRPRRAQETRVVPEREAAVMNQEWARFDGEGRQDDLATAIAAREIAASFLNKLLRMVSERCTRVLMSDCV